MSKSHQTITFGCLSDYVGEAKANVDRGLFETSFGYGFEGVESWEEALVLGRDGWRDQEAEAMSIAESAIAEIERTQDIDKHRAVWDVCGTDVDVGAFLAGEPENMIDWHMASAPSVGRVVTICASVSASGAISTDTFMRRGAIVASFAIAMQLLGFNVELWLDDGAKGGGKSMSMRTLIKGPNDELDVARIMFAMAHPAILRVVGFGASHSLRPDIKRAVGIGNGYGAPIDAVHDLPDGTIYLPCLMSSWDVPDAPEGLRRLLIEAGVIDNDA